LQFDFLEHTADAYIAAYGKTLDEAFENAALAMFEIITDIKTIRRGFQTFVVLVFSQKSFKPPIIHEVPIFYSCSRISVGPHFRKLVCEIFKHFCLIVFLKFKFVK